MFIYFFNTLLSTNNKRYSSLLLVALLFLFYVYSCRKGTASVAETAKKFGGTRPSPPAKQRISVSSKPDKPEKPGEQ